jgi:hypothetical protein
MNAKPAHDLKKAPASVSELIDTIDQHINEASDLLEKFRRRQVETAARDASVRKSDRATR